MLLGAYGSYPVACAAKDSCDTAFILHTSDTDAPSGKPVGRSFLEPFGIIKRILSDAGEEKKKFKLPEVPESIMNAVLKYGNRLAGIPNGREWMDFDFED